MKKTFVISLLALTALVVGLIFGNGTLINKKQESGKVIKVGYPAISTSLPLFVAIEEGLFDGNGYTVKPVQFQTANQIVEALVTGRIDATAVAADYPFLSMATKIEGAFEIYAWEMLDTEIPFDVILSNSDSNIKELANLQGKTIATFPGSQLKYYLGLILAKAVGSDIDVNIIEMAPANQISALAAGSVDALFTLEPIATIAVTKGIGQIVESSVISRYIGDGDAIPAASFAVSSGFKKEHSVIAKSFVHAMWDSMDLINADQMKYRYLYPKFTPIQEGLASQIPVTIFTKAADMDVALFQKEADILFEAGLLDKNINVENLVYKD